MAWPISWNDVNNLMENGGGSGGISIENIDVYVDLGTGRNSYIEYSGGIVELFGSGIVYYFVDNDAGAEFVDFMNNTESICRTRIHDNNGTNVYMEYSTTLTPSIKFGEVTFTKEEL